MMLVLDLPLRKDSFGAGPEEGRGALGVAHSAEVIEARAGQEGHSRALRTAGRLPQRG
jgi:hypothetical protein